MAGNLRAGGTAITRHGWSKLAALAAALVVTATLPTSGSAQVGTGPATTFESGPEDPTPTNDSTPTFEFSSTDPLATFECAVDDGPAATCDSPHTTDALGDGPHSISVRAVDGLASPGDWATRSFTVDTAAPAVSIGSGPADPDPTNDPTPTFAFSSDDLTASFECALDGGQASACDSPFTTAALADGPHSLEVRATDAAGNQGSESRAFTVDTTAPTVSIDSGPGGAPTNDPTPSFGFSSNEPGATFECSVDGGAFAACSPPHTTGALSDGSHSFAVRATDAPGNLGGATTRTFAVDTAAPDVSIDSGPGGATPTNDPTPSFGFSSTDTGASFQCSVDGGPYTACSSLHTTAALSDGSHSFAVRAIDAAGNESAAATRSFSVDTAAPSISIDSGPNGPTNDPTPTFGFSSNDAGATFQCSVDGGGFSGCSSPHTTSALGAGPHSFQVRATDAAGNQATSAARGFSVDTTAPSVSIDSGPNGSTKDATPTFHFTSTDTGAAFECSVDGGTFSACTSPHTTATLGDGAHSFAVRPVDTAGNRGAAATRNLTVDTAPPSVSIGSGPSGQPPTNDSTPSFGFTSNEPGVTFACAVDSGSFAACSSPHTTGALGDGSHSFHVRATDAAGNQGSVATQTFAIDTVGPAATIDAGPAEPVPTADSTPTFLFSSNDPDAGFECALDGGGFAACNSPHTTAALSQGHHQIDVRALDPAGNRGPAAERGFTVDSSVPAVTFTEGPDGPTRNRRPTFTFTSAPGSSFGCRLDDTVVPCPSGSFTPASDLADGDHLFEARATNSAGTTGSYELRPFSVDTTGPETVIVSLLPVHTTERTPRFEFSGSEAGVSFECSLDGGGFSPCTSPWTSPQLALGPHRMEVRALDSLGNPDATPALAEFTVADTPPPPPPPKPDVDAGVRTLAQSLVSNLDRAAGPLATTEMGAILRRGGLTVTGMSALVPGTLTIAASAPARGSTKTVLSGSTDFGAVGTAPIVLKPTSAGRAMMRRYATVPLLLRVRFLTAQGLALTANREATLVRDFLTPAEAKSAVARRLARMEGERVRKLAVQVLARCGSNCLKIQVNWLAKRRHWSASGRARQVKGDLSARLGTVVSARR